MNWGQFRCFHCQRVLVIAGHGLCSRCVSQSHLKAYCGKCGSALQENALACGHCLRHEPKWHRFVQVAPYQMPLSHWIHRFKYQQEFGLDHALARLLLLAVKQAQRVHQLPLPEVLMPVPLFWRRKWKRGFNQSELLARSLSHWLRIPVDNESLQRVLSTPAQQTLNASQRHQNLKKAFVYQPKHPYRRVAIIDDVLTTGSTLDAICKVLLKQQVQEIQVWVLAKT